MKNWIRNWVKSKKTITFFILLSLWWLPARWVVKAFLRLGQRGHRNIHDGHFSSWERQLPLRLSAGWCFFFFIPPVLLLGLSSYSDTRINHVLLKMINSDKWLFHLFYCLSFITIILTGLRTKKWKLSSTSLIWSDSEAIWKPHSRFLLHIGRPSHQS